MAGTATLPDCEFLHKKQPIGDEYRIDWDTRLGTGISGPVRQCVHRATDVKCALKCLSDSARARLEVKLHLQCSSHPHVVPARDVFLNHIQIPGDPVPKNRILVVMDYMGGGELFDRIKEKRSFTEREASEAMLQIASAVHHLHHQNIAHRDLKPENLLLKDRSATIHIALTDFGFAKIDNGTLQTPQFTPYYVAPQVLEAQRRHYTRKRGGNPSPYTYDRSCDIWSLGVIMYIMLCGYPPFYSESPTKSITPRMKHKITAGQYEFPSREWDGVSDAAKDLIRRCLDVEPDRRITIRQMQEHPWLRESGSLPNLELCSPSIMLEDEEAMFSASAAHSAQLREMRIDVNTITLKPLGSTTNRLMSNREGRLGARKLAAKQSTDGSLRALRDLLAYLTMPPPPSSTADLFTMVVTRMAQNALTTMDPPNADFNDILARHSWNGNGFDRLVDGAALCRDVTHFVHAMTVVASA